MGIHGEPGITRTKLQKADDVAAAMGSRVIGDLPFGKGDEVAVLVNGLGATPAEELYILYGRFHDMLKEQGIAVHRVFLGEFATSMEMAGASFSLLRLDEEFKGLLGAPAFSPFLPQWRSP